MRRGCQFPCTVVVVWWLLFPPQEIRDSLILCSLAFFLSPKLTTLLPLIIWIPHHKKMWQTRVGEGCCFWNVKKSIWIQIHLSKQLTLEDKFQFFKFEVQKGNPTLTNETSWTNVRLVNYKDLAKGIRRWLTKWLMTDSMFWFQLLFQRRASQPQPLGQNWFQAKFPSPRDFAKLSKRKNLWSTNAPNQIRKCKCCGIIEIHKWGNLSLCSITSWNFSLRIPSTDSRMTNEQLVQLSVFKQRFWEFAAYLCVFAHW